MKILETTIPGCFELLPDVLRDGRGYFVKTFHRGTFSDLGLSTRFAEEYYTYSHRNVLRGLHFQTPPHDHVKIVYCVNGSVIDAVLDIRVGSPTYGKYLLIDLSADKANIIYIPRGMAHGFYVTSDRAIMHYKVTTTYVPESDAGVLWSSAGIPWPTENPITSPRDAGFARFSEFKSPFTYHPENDHGPW